MRSVIRCDDARDYSYAAAAGTLTGGGLTVTADAANPAGPDILSSLFTDGANPHGLLLGALPATHIIDAAFDTL